MPLEITLTDIEAGKIVCIVSGGLSASLSIDVFKPARKRPSRDVYVYLMCSRFQDTNHAQVRIGHRFIRN